MKHVILAVVTMAMAGCALVDWDGNGKIDPIAYLDNADVTVAWVADDGTVYTMAVDQMGVAILGDFIYAKTGGVFELTQEQDGSVGIAIHDSHGQTVYIKPKLDNN